MKFKDDETEEVDLLGEDVGGKWLAEDEPLTLQEAAEILGPLECEYYCTKTVDKTLIEAFSSGDPAMREAYMRLFELTRSFMKYSVAMLTTLATAYEELGKSTVVDLPTQAYGEYVAEYVKSATDNIVKTTKQIKEEANAEDVTASSWFGTKSDKDKLN